jgi:hypothetical protein
VIVHRRRSLALYLPASLRKREQEEETHRGLTTHSGPSRENKHKECDIVFADVTEMLEDRIAGASRADGGRKFDVKDVSWASAIISGQRRLLLKAKSLAVCPFSTIGFSDIKIHALQTHRPSSFVLPLPVHLLAQGGRLASRSSVSPPVAAARK